MAATVVMDDEGRTRDITTKIIVDILQRLPPSSRRRCRLVCRQWRDTVDRRTREMQSRAKALVQTPDSTYVLRGDLSAGSSRLREVLRDYKGMCIVGTCNGLVCLCDDEKPGGAITVVNPVTGEVLTMPPVPSSATATAADADDDQATCHSTAWHEAYSFAYHPTTGRYKVVHVPCRFDADRREFDTVQAFTLGEASWRDIISTDPSGVGRCNLGAGVVSVNGETYWAAEGAGEVVVMSFNLEDERVASVKSPPVLPQPGIRSWQLTAVRGRLAVACRRVSETSDKTEVWVLLEGNASGERRERCCSWYGMQVHGPLHEISEGRQQQLAWPHFAHGGDHVILTWKRSVRPERIHVFRHDATRSQDFVVGIGSSRRNRGTEVGRIMTCHDTCRTFAYVETTEPLSVYVQAGPRHS